MLSHIHIKNVAVIENLSVDLKKGMTVLTGETGAGKSIIIDSINLILGARTNKALVRYGENKARIQAVFDVEENISDILSRYDIETEDNQVIISRDITADGRSVSRINSTVVSTALLREVGNYLINIHGQHDNQSLLTPSKHIIFLDKFARDSRELDEYKSIYLQYREIERKIQELNLNEREKAQRIDLLSYQTNEIKEADLKIGEYEQLCEQRDIIANAEKISVGVGEAFENLYESRDTQSAYDAISIAVSALDKIKDFDQSLAQIYSKLNNMVYEIEDYAHELKEFSEKTEYDENVLNDIEERLDVISRLKRKYGGSIEEILAFYEKAKEELDEINDSDERIAELEKTRSELEKQLENAARNLSKVRAEAAKTLAEKIQTSLAELDMVNSKFGVEIAKTDNFLPNGTDNVEFMISTNAGEPMKPLVKIASGGELSRVMLAVKSILADADEVDTMIFDEIDTGVSGSAAKKIAAKLHKTADGKQVICITHLAALAAEADNHYLIRKNVSDGKTNTILEELDFEKREKELARIIDGSDITQTALKHAREMLSKKN